MRATHSDPAKIRLCLRSIEIFRTWQEIYGDDIEWVTGGYNFVAYREQEEKTLKTLLAKQKSLGLNIDWYDRQDLLKIVPGLNPVDLIGGTYSPEDGNCSPLLALHAFYTQACQAGAVFRYNEPVPEMVIRSGKVHGDQDHAGRVCRGRGHQRRRRLGAPDGPDGRAGPAGQPRLPRSRDHRIGGAIPRPDGRGYPPWAGQLELLFLPA